MNIEEKLSNSVKISHVIDKTNYWVVVSWTGKASISETKAHTFALVPKSDDVTVSVEYFSGDVKYVNGGPWLNGLLTRTKDFWNEWWQKGAIVDFSDCTDSRA